MYNPATRRYELQHDIAVSVLTAILAILMLCKPCHSALRTPARYSCECCNCHASYPHVVSNPATRRYELQQDIAVSVLPDMLAILMLCVFVSNPATRRYELQQDIAVSVLPEMLAIVMLCTILPLGATNSSTI